MAASTSSPPSGKTIAENFCRHVLTEEFWEKHWEKYPLHHRGAEKGKDGNLLPEVLSVSDIMSVIRTAGSSLKIFRKGDPYDLDNFLVAYLDGASMIVNQADRHNKTLYELCCSLAERHFLHVFGVVYLTPPGSQAVRLHNDDQDVFLMQVWGRKSWTIRPAPKLLPYTEEMLGKETPVPEELIQPPVMEFDMEAHDVLYIPRGFLHEAATGEELSLHVTITIPTSDYCWGVQVVKHMMHELHSGVTLPRELQALCKRPLGKVGRRRQARNGGPAANEGLEQVLKAWNSGLNADSVVAAFEQRMARTNEGQSRAFAKMSSFPPRPGVSEGCRVRLMHGVSCECEVGDEVAIFTRASDGQHLEMPIAPSASEVIAALTSKPQPVLDLPSKDPFGRAALLQLLCEHGVVQVFLEDARAPSGPA